MRAKLDSVLQAVNQVLLGKEQQVRLALTCLLAEGHLLIEDLPGMGKTTLSHTLAKVLGLSFQRIQFTSDLLPGDILGTSVFDKDTGQFVFHPGPIFAELVLADEINRATPKSQSALLEAMQERFVTVHGETHALPRPFIVLATQNPIELEGTYQLPEAQLDRFLFKLEVHNPDIAVLERIVATRRTPVETATAPVLNELELEWLMNAVSHIHIPQAVANMIARLVHATHPSAGVVRKGVRCGASPRAAISLAVAASARALFLGRAHAAFEDVRVLAGPVLAHRLILDYHLRLQGVTTSEIVREIVEATPALTKELPPLLEELQ
jgi:MoxR-like ATPase